MSFGVIVPSMPDLRSISMPGRPAKVGLPKPVTMRFPSITAVRSCVAMDSMSQSEERHINIADPVIETGVELLRAIFDEHDNVLFRPIETWTDAGKKRSRVVHKSVIYTAANPARLSLA